MIISEHILEVERNYAGVKSMAVYHQGLPYHLNCNGMETLVYSAMEAINSILPAEPTIFDKSTLRKQRSSTEESFTTTMLGYVPDLEMKMNIVGQLLQPLMKEIYVENEETTKQVTLNKISLSCYPNPSNSSVNIKIYLQNKSQVYIYICDMTDRKIEHILSGELNEGIHKFDWSCKSCQSGVYFVILNTGKQQIVKRITISK